METSISIYRTEEEMKSKECRVGGFTYVTLGQAHWPNCSGSACAHWNWAAVGHQGYADVNRTQASASQDLRSHGYCGLTKTF